MVKIDRKSLSPFHHSTLPTDVSKLKLTESRKLFSTDTHLFVSFREYLVAKDFSHSPRDEDSQVKILKSSSWPITCLGLGNKSYVICTCTDESVFIWKQDSLLKDWTCKKVAKSVGKTVDCSIFVTGSQIFVCLSKIDEVIVIRCISHTVLDLCGALDLRSIEMFGRVEKMKEANTWIRCFGNNFKLNIIGLAHGNGISMRLWDVSPECSDDDGGSEAGSGSGSGSGIGRLVHQQSVPQIKSLASADLSFEKMGKKETVMMLLGVDGQVEVFLVLATGFSLINRVKIDDRPDDGLVRGCVRQEELNAAAQGMKVEFCILTGKFIWPNKKCVTKPAASQSDDIKDHSNEGDRDKSLASGQGGEREEPSSLCPQLLAVIASSTRVSVVNLRSGEIQMSLRYEDVDEDVGMLVNNMTLAFDADNCELVGAMQMMMDTNLYLLKVSLNFQQHPPSASTSSFLISREVIRGKSVLRKKLKSPRNETQSIGLKGTKSMTTSFLRKKDKLRSTKSGACAASGSAGAGAGGGSSSTTLKTSYTISVDTKPRTSGWPGKTKGGGDTPENSSPRLKMKDHLSLCYEKGGSLRFNCDEPGQFPPLLSDNGVSTVRMSSSTDGKYIALGANVSPVVVLKTQPTFENLRSYKDMGRVSSLHFAFNSKYLLVATNDCTTRMMDWQNNKELLNLKFCSKFGELVGSQFYFMDKFILQAEENRLALYSYALRASGNVTLKAGSFILPCQNITAIAAPNLFYSHYIICGLSSKCLQVFDANVEKVAVTLRHSHTRPINSIRLNEAPKGTLPTAISDLILTSAPSYADPIKLWDLRTSKCVTRIGDVNGNHFVPTARPSSLSPCGRYIASGFEDNSVIVYDIRKINSRVEVLKGIRSTVLDCHFDPTHPILWCASRNGHLFNFPAH